MTADESLKYHVTLNRGGWPMSASIAVVMGILALWFLLPNIFLIAALLLLALYALTLHLRYMYLQNHELMIQGDNLIKLNSSGIEINRIDLRKPLEVRYLFKGNSDALYKLSQGKTHIQFSAETRGAERVVTEVLQLQWPPVAHNWIPL